MEFRLIQDLIEKALTEDLAWGDITADRLIQENQYCDLYLVLRVNGVVSGMEVAERVFKTLDPSAIWEPMVKDGDVLEADTVIARVSGKAIKLVQAERTALNFMQRLSGISTMTHQYVSEVRKVNSKCRITGTRKTTPGHRYLEKYAIRMGGGHNHRFSLADMAMIKDNHLALLAQQGKTLGYAVQKLRDEGPHSLKIEVEVDRLDQVQEVIDSRADVILLDNMSLEDMTAAVKLIDRRLLVEASGGVTIERVAPIAATGVDIISVGGLTHSVKSIDIGLDYR